MDSSLESVTCYSYRSDLYIKEKIVTVHLGGPRVALLSIVTPEIDSPDSGNDLEHRHVAQVAIAASGGRFSRGTMTSRERTLEGRRQEAIW